MSQDLEQKIDVIMQEFVSPDGPGVAALIGRDDQVLVRKAYGLANVERREPLTPENRFIMASVTKQFVGMAVMLLKHRGLLGYDDTIARFFPGYPTWKNEIIVRHLLNQTSGLQEYLTKSFWKEAAEHGGSIALDGLLQRIGTLLSNAEGIGVEQIHGAIAEELLVDKMAPLVPVHLPADALAEKVGTYTGKPRDRAESLEIVNTPEKGALSATRRWEAEGFALSETADLVPLSRDLFLMDRRSDKYLAFTREGGSISGVLIRSGGVVTSLPVKKGTP